MPVCPAKGAIVVDKQFLEFWGNFLINAAKGQRQLEDMSKWINQGLEGFDELTAMFTKFYGLEHMEKDSPDYMATWKKASEDFSKSFKDYLLLMGVVPKDKHLTLVKKYEQLKEKVASQEETIKHLRMLLNAKKAQAQGDIAKEFQDLIEKQSEQFQETMETFGRLFKKDENQS